MRSFDQRFDRVMHRSEVWSAQIDHDDVGGGARSQAPEIISAKRLRPAQRRGVEHVGRLTDPEAAFGKAAHQSGQAHLGDQILRERIGTECDVDAELAIALERLEHDAHLGVLVRRVCYRRA